MTMQKYVFNTPSSYLLSTKPNFYYGCLLKKAQVSSKSD